MVPHILAQLFTRKQFGHKILDFVNYLRVTRVIQRNIVNFGGFRYVVLGVTLSKNLVLEINDAVLKTEQIRICV